MKNLRNSKQRQIILDAVRARCDHPTADQIYLDVRSKDEHISRGTVYRNLGILAETHEIVNLKVRAADRYDSRVDYHYHLICMGCGKILDAPLPYQLTFDTEVAQATHFQIERHRLLFEGFCPDCALKESAD